MSEPTGIEIAYEKLCDGRLLSDPEIVSLHSHFAALEKSLIALGPRFSILARAVSQDLTKIMALGMKRNLFL